MYRSHIEETASASHSNGPPGQKCYTMHGHDFLVEVDIEYSDLDEYGWGPGFGEVKDVIREFDHQNLNNLLDVSPSAENLARIIHDRLVEGVLAGRTDAFHLEVTVHEGEGNSVTYQ